MKKTKTLAICVALLSSTFVFSQTQGIAYTAVGKGVATTFVTDYHSLGINTSALGWEPFYEGKRFTLGMTEFSAGISSPALDRNRLKNAFQGIQNQIGGKSGDFDWQQQADAAADYAESGMTINASYNWFGASFQHDVIGGFAISVNENFNWFSQLSEQTTDLIFRGRLSNVFDSLTIAMNGDTTVISNTGNLSQDTLSSVIAGNIGSPKLISELTQGSRIKFLWNRHFNFGYGRKIFGDPEKFALYGGVGVRYIQAIGMFDLASENNEIHARTAMSPFFGINFGAGSSTTNDKFMPQTIGQGYGVDVSASVIMFGKLRLAAAVNNVGAVTYKRNVYKVRDTIVGTYFLPGLDDANVLEAIDQLSEGENFLKFQGEEKIVVNNAATFRLGGSIALFEEKLHVGVDLVAPFNRDQPGSLQNAIFSVGGDIRPVKWLQLSLGYFGGGVYAHNMPVGINFILGGGTYEFGISSQDAISFFKKDANSISMAMGIARFRF